MMKFRLIIGIISVIFFTTSASLAVTVINKSGGSGSSAPSSVKIFKTTVMVTKFENNTLYAANGQKYNLRNVKVNDYTASRKIKTDKNMTAEFMYVNDVLKEVTIR